ncbi:MAG TPA: hypothetical protein VL728_11125 [Cyclobacteriaceae bacterium]|jgi:hypothetical protein|nr:hypothetical protein [Cyclobacteriaceae bacterium]
MNTKTILATAAGAVINFLGGWVVFGIVLSGFYMANTKTYEGLSKGEMPDLLFIFVSGIFNAYLVTYLLRRAGSKEFTFANGFKHGLVAYFCMAAWVNFSIYSFYNLMNMTLVLTDIFVQAIFGGVNGGIMALILGSGKKE